MRIGVINTTVTISFMLLPFTVCLLLGDEPVLSAESRFARRRRITGAKDSTSRMLAADVMEDSGCAQKKVGEALAS